MLGLGIVDLWFKGFVPYGVAAFGPSELGVGVLDLAFGVLAFGLPKPQLRDFSIRHLFAAIGKPKNPTLSGGRAIERRVGCAV